MSFVSYGQIIEKQTQTTYVIKMTEQEYQNYLNSKNNTSIIPKTTKPSIYDEYKKEGSFGAVGGVSTMIGALGDFYNFSGGGWIEYKNIGVEYIMSAAVTNDISATNFVLGQTSSWIAGGSAISYGAFFKQDNGLYYGGGLQTSTVLGLEYKPNVRNNVYLGSTTTNTNDKKTLPYVTIGYMKNLGDLFIFKGGVLISKFTSLNVGVGYKF